MRSEYEANNYLAATRKNGRLMYKPEHPKYVWLKCGAIVAGAIFIMWLLVQGI